MQVLGSPFTFGTIDYHASVVSGNVPPHQASHNSHGSVGGSENSRETSGYVHAMGGTGHGLGNEFVGSEFDDGTFHQSAYSSDITSIASRPSSTSSPTSTSMSTAGVAAHGSSYSSASSEHGIQYQLHRGSQQQASFDAAELPAATSHAKWEGSGNAGPQTQALLETAHTMEYRGAGPSSNDGASFGGYAEVLQSRTAGFAFEMSQLQYHSRSKTISAGVSGDSGGPVWSSIQAPHASFS